MIFLKRFTTVMGRVEEGDEGLGIPITRSTNQHFGKKERRIKRFTQFFRRVRHSGSSPKHLLRRERDHPSAPGEEEESRV
jgi:hypothetical protein